MIGSRVAPLYGLVGLYSLLEVWSKCACGQVAFVANPFLSRKPLIGGFSFLEASFSLLLLTVLNDPLLFHEHQ